MSGKLWRQKTGRTATIVMSLMFGLLCRPDVGQADGYFNTMNLMNKMRVEAKGRTDYIQYFCEGDSDPDTVFGQRSLAEYGQHFTKRYPGSTLNCLTHSGTWIDGENTYYFSKNSVYKHVLVANNGLTYETNFAAQFTMFRMSDAQSNFIQIKCSRNNPNDCQYSEAKLPINVQSGGVVSGQNKGYQYSSDELVTGMNFVYKQLSRLPDSHMFGWGNQLLLDRNERNDFLNMARKAMGEPKALKLAKQKPQKQQEQNTEQEVQDVQDVQAGNTGTNEGTENTDATDTKKPFQPNSR